MKKIDRGREKRCCPFQKEKLTAGKPVVKKREFTKESSQPFLGIGKGKC